MTAVTQVHTKKRDVAAPRRSKAAEPDGAAYAIGLLDELAAGNVDVVVDAKRAAADPLVAAVARLAASLRGTLGELLVGSTLVDRSSSAMTATAKSVRDNAGRIRRTMSTVLDSTEDMRQNMNSVSAATEELAANMKSIAGAARQSNGNIDSVQVSIRELTTASREIAENTARATAISKGAMADVTSAFALVNELTTAAKDIDVVTATISEISDQTKLLALNATIESARAGEMGKGFAVVAKEVKDLASQTNTATKDIQSKIGIIHEVTRRTVAAITTMNGVMKSVNEAITSIAAAAEEQSVTTDDIAQNVVSATERIKEMSNSVGEGALAVQDVSKSIVDATNLANAVAGSIRDLSTNNAAVEADAVTSYAQALEVASHVGDIGRRLGGLTLPDDVRAAADGAPLELCRFSSDFDVEVGRMNDDHRRIFEHVNALHAAIKEKQPQRALLGTFRDLAEITRQHFAREEEAMVRTQYPALAAQQRAHQKLLKQVSDIQASLESGGEVDLIEVMAFLRDWLIEHILGMDKKYGPWLVEHGVR
jgi:hemerythrin-like metal-binding protein